MNQPNGFDCPGCAWPEAREHRSSFEFCENGAKALAWEATRRRADPAFFARHTVDALAAESDHWLGQQGRLTHPMRLREGARHYEPIAWDEAFALIAGCLNALANPDQAAFYTSGRTSNEAAFLYQLFVRQFGTNNLPDCSNMCHESSGFALRESLGVGKGTVQLDDFEKADAIFVIGQNPGTNHPRMMTVLGEAAARGCRIVSVNPLCEAALSHFQNPQDPLALLGHRQAITHLHLPVRIGGDAALFKGIMKLLLDDHRARGGVIDRDFIEQHTTGFPAFTAALDGVALESLVSESGITVPQMRAAADVVRGARRIIACWAMGLTQHSNAVATIQEVVNFLLLRGNIGRPGAGACPVRGHSNVQGDRTMGIWEQPEPAFLDRLAARYAFDPPRHHGLDTIGTIEAMRDGRLSVFFAMGGNFLSATPDTHETARALARCALTVHVSTKPNRAHLVTGKQALILPCLGRSERDVTRAGVQFVTVEDSMSVVHTSQGHLTPASPHLLSEVAIVARLAAATLGTRSQIPWLSFCEDNERLRDEIAAVIPGFENMNARVRAPGGFTLPNAARERRWTTPSGKAVFTAHPLRRRQLVAGRLLLTTIRSHDQFNTTIYGLDDRYRGVKNGRRVVFLNHDDMKDRDLRAGQLVDLTSHNGGRVRVAPRFAVVPYPLPRGAAAAYFPEANVLVPLESFAEKSRTPTSKAIEVTVEPA
jgi:molybdopterin-dependent oxidoreductase alpha subunit